MGYLLGYDLQFDLNLMCVKYFTTITLNTLDTLSILGTCYNTNQYLTRWISQKRTYWKPTTE
jgi:hypothetical protein